MLVRIAAGATELIAAPDLGGGVAHLRWRGRDMLRASPPAPQAPTDLAEFPLAPFANRIADGRFVWRRQEVVLERPPQGGAHALHGHAWRLPWQVMAHAADRLTLALQATACAAWPWDVRLERSFLVTEDGAAFALSLTCEGPGPMPAGLGFHPYFPAAEAVLRLHVDRQIEATPDLLPHRFAPTPVCAAFGEGAPVAGLALDHAFAGWDGRAEILWPDRSVTMEADPGLPFVHVYAPKEQDFFCVEPVSAMPNAVNWQGEEQTGLQRLAQGETQRATMRLHFASRD